MFFRVVSPKNSFKTGFKASTAILFEILAIFALRPRGGDGQKFDFSQHYSHFKQLNSYYTSFLAIWGALETFKHSFRKHSAVIFEILPIFGSPMLLSAVVFSVIKHANIIENKSLGVFKPCLNAS